MSFNPILGGFTALDISGTDQLIVLIKWAAKVLETDRFMFLDEEGKPGQPFSTTQGDFPEHYLRAWQERGGVGFRPVSSESTYGAANWHVFDPKNASYSSNSFYMSAPVDFWEKNLDRAACLLAEVVHQFDCIIGDLRLGGVKLWLGSPENGLISIPHITCFGSPYIRLFGLEKLLDAPVFKAKQIHENAVVLQLFDSLVSPESSEWQIMQRRLREHLGLRYFRELSGKSGRSASFSALNLLKLVQFISDTAQTSQERGNAKSATGEPILAPEIDWQRMRTAK